MKTARTLGLLICTCFCTIPLAADMSFDPFPYTGTWLFGTHTITAQLTITGGTFKGSSSTAWFKTPATATFSRTITGNNPQDLRMTVIRFVTGVNISTIPTNQWFNVVTLPGTEFYEGVASKAFSLTETRSFGLDLEENGGFGFGIQKQFGYYLMLDNTAPTVTWSSKPTSWTSGTVGASLTINDNSGGSGISSVTLKDPKNVTTTLWSTTIGPILSSGLLGVTLTGGAGTYTLTSTDNVGNVGTQTFTLADVTAPTLSHNIAASNIATTTVSSDGKTKTLVLRAAKTAGFTVTAADIAGDSGVDTSNSQFTQTVINGQGVSTTTGPTGIGSLSKAVSITSGTAGQYTWTFTVKDNAGNVGQTLVIKQTVLISLPSININPPVDSSVWVTNNAFTITGTDGMGRTQVTTPALVHLLFSSDGKAVGDATKTWTSLSGNPYVNPASGVSVRDFKVIDEANQSTTVTKTFQIDTELPHLSMTANGQPVNWGAGIPIFLSSVGQISVFQIIDGVSGVKELKVSAPSINNGQASVLYSTNAAGIHSASPTFTPSGDHVYTFALTDVAGNVTTVSNRFVVASGSGDLSADVKLWVTDLGHSNAQVPATGATGNFTNLHMSIENQGQNSIKPVSAVLTWDGYDSPTVALATTDNSTYTAALRPDLTQESEGTAHNFQVAITDQAARVTRVYGTVTLDRTAPTIEKTWVVIDKTSPANVFTVQPDETEVQVYQTNATHSLTSGATLLWDNASVPGAAGSFAPDAGGVDTIYLAAVDAAGNTALANFRVVRPAQPAAPSLTKVVAADFRSYVLQAADPAVAASYGGVTYSIGYQGISVSAQGDADAADSASNASGTPFAWTNVGHKGYWKAWKTLTAQAADSGTIAVDQTGSAVVFAIPNSPPHFRTDIAWPTYLGASPVLTVPAVDDPDGDAVYYRVETQVGNLVTTSAATNDSTLKGAWGNQLPAGGTVRVEAWAGTGEPFADSAFVQLSHDYDAQHVDVTPPEVSEVGSPWADNPQWTSASSFALGLRDPSTGASNLASAQYSLVPIHDDTSEDAGRTAWKHQPLALNAGAQTAHFTISLPAGLDGLYQLNVSVTDQAGNSNDSFYKIALFDHNAPVLASVTIGNPYDAAQTRYNADRIGNLKMTLGSSDSQSGLSAWAYQRLGGDWTWAPWMGGSVTISPDWSTGTTQAVRFQTRDKVGNVSSPSSWTDVYFDKTPPDASLEVGGMTGSESAGYYVRTLESLSVVASPTLPGTKWNLVRSLDDGSQVVSQDAASWSELVQTASLWVDGARYRLQVTMANSNGVEAKRLSPSFVLDRTAPTAVSLTLLPPTDRTRSAFHENEPFVVTWLGGEDAQTPVTREIRLYQMLAGVKTTLATVGLGTGETQAVVHWGGQPVAWSSGGFYVEATAANAAASVTQSASVAVPVSGSGIGVSAPAYNAGTGQLPLSWSAGTVVGITNYSYQLWLQGDFDTALTGEETTTATSAVVDVSPLALADGAKVFAVVKAYDEAGTLLSVGSSAVSTVDLGSPTAAWTHVASASVSSLVQALFRTTSSQSGLASVKWLVEKQSNDALWTTIPGPGGEDWRVGPTAGSGEIAADLSADVHTGDVVRLTLLVENAVGRTGEASTGSILIDDTPPPAPLVLDQGAAINPTLQNLNFHWDLSQSDAESSLVSYSYGWFYKGEATEPTLWTKVQPDVLAASILPDLQGSDGKSVVLAVKAENGAGVETIGYSDGIILDSGAPYVAEMRVYADSARTTPLTGYVKSGAIVSASQAFLSVQAYDQESWVQGGLVQAYEWNGAQSTWEAVGSPLNINGLETTFDLPSGFSFAPGTQWRFDAQAIDTAGNVSESSVSNGFIVEGSTPSVVHLQTFVDNSKISLTWDLDNPADGRWIKSYSVVVQTAAATTVLQTTTKAASVEWGAGGLGLTTGESVNFQVQAVSYTGAIQNSPQTSDYRTSVTIDASAPALDAQATTVPAAAGASMFYDAVQGHVQYQSARGVSSLQWRAVLVPGEIPLTDWQDKRWVNQWDFEKPFSEISGQPLSAWNAKQIRLQFRAANSMGIWSEVSNTTAIGIDTTDPETAEVTRSSAYSNQTNSVSGWNLRLQDSESGILAYMTALVPADQLSAGYQWPVTAVKHTVADTSAAALTAQTIDIPLTSGNEGAFVPLVRVLNGTGHWSVVQGPSLVVDRTAPTLTGLTWPGSGSETTTINGVTQTIPVINDDTSASFAATASEAVKWTISTLWSGAQTQPASGYSAAAAGTVGFDANSVDSLFTVKVLLEDQAGNPTAQDVVLRYNRAPVVEVNTSALTVRPGNPVKLADLVTVSDLQRGGEADYPLSFFWLPGGSGGAQQWSGGSDASTPFGDPELHTGTYVQTDPHAQKSTYTGTLVVTDRYLKSTTVSLAMTVENTRAGDLKVDEYWTGDFVTRGWVVVGPNRTLTVDNARITANAPLTGDTMEAGVLVQPGGTLVVTNSTFETAFPGIDWRGLRVQGNLSGTGLQVFGAERAVTLDPTGNVQLTSSWLSGNQIGLHLLGGVLNWNTGTLGSNDEYGVKEDAVGTYSLRNTVFQNNGVSYYQTGATQIDMAELNSRPGNSGNQEVHQ